MNNYEQFKNKEISEAEASNVLGGSFLDCINADPFTPGGSCTLDYFHIIVSQSGGPGECGILCLEAACAIAQFACNPQ